MTALHRDHIIEIHLSPADDWPHTLSETVVEVTQRLQSMLEEFPDKPVLLSLICPDQSLGSNTGINATIEACRGFAQSVALEVQTSRCSMMVTTADQELERSSTALLFHGPNGGFIAGATFDLRSDK